MSSKKYHLNTNVLDAAIRRIEYIFDEFENIVVSISGGKDSTVLCHLALEEAKRRSRKVGLFYLDEEVVYASTIEQVEYLMNLAPDHSVRYWLQIEFNLTNAVDLRHGQFHCWDPQQRPNWMHKRSSKNVLTRTWTHDTTIIDKNKGFGFYDVLTNFELGFENTAFLVGLRADESLDRYRTMVRFPGYKDVMWSTDKKRGNYVFYPLYDWAFSDVWKYIGEQELRYHRYYDFCFLKGMSPHGMRVSSLLHEKSFKAVQDLPSFEFKTYERLLKRTKGISFAQETATDRKMFRCQTLPKNFSTWRAYRDFLLATYPAPERKAIFKRRFSKHLDNEYVARQQCRQLVLNDYENNLPVKNTEDPKTARLNHWKEIL